MSQRKVWYPGKSLALHDENYTNPAVIQPRRRTAKIIRRKEPTVDTRTASAILLISQEKAGYNTIESNTYNGLELYDDWKEMSNSNDICGWRDNEHSAAYHQTWFGGRDSIIIRNNLPSREVSSRLYSSRLNSQMSRRRDKYRFQHCDSVDGHIKLYNDQCGYSHLLQLSNKKEAMLEEDEERVEREREYSFKGKQKYVQDEYRHHTRTKLSSSKFNHTAAKGSTLQKLAYRLGVQGSIEEPKLIHSPKTTPPTISKKKNEMREDLVVHAKGKWTETHVSNETEDKDTQKPSASRKGRRIKNTQQLPAIITQTDRKPKSTSTISINKYFHVNTNKRDNFQTEDIIETGGEEDMCLLTSESSSLLSDNSVEDLPGHNQHEQWPAFVSVDPLVEGVGKDEIIKRKANSLGLLSHKWAKNFIERGFMNGCLPRKLYYDYSRPGTKEVSRKTEKTEESQRQEKKIQVLEDVYGGAKSKLKTRLESASSITTQKAKRELDSNSRRHYNSHSRGTTSRPPTRSISLPERHLMSSRRDTNSGLYRQSVKQQHVTGNSNYRTTSSMKKIDIEGTKWNTGNVIQLEGLTHRLSARMETPR